MIYDFDYKMKSLQRYIFHVYVGMEKFIVVLFLQSVVLEIWNFQLVCYQSEELNYRRCLGKKAVRNILMFVLIL